MVVESRKDGFTLVELMIVVAIIGIIAAISYPSYVEYVKKSKRRDAQAALMGLSGAMERLHTSCGSYSSAAVGSGTTSKCVTDYIFPDKAPLDGNTKFYQLAISGADQSVYTLTAKPIAGSSQEDDGCMVFFSSGERCWYKDNDACDANPLDCSGASDW